MPRASDPVSARRRTAVRGKRSDDEFAAPPVLNYRWFALALVITWTGLLALFATWEVNEIWKHTYEKARSDARASFQKDVLYRYWASQHGGVYVPVTISTPPNPYLQKIPERDLTTPSGRELTLMNPAYMTRQVHEIGAQRFGVRSHITSLNPIRAENRADAWETTALQKFETGAPEVAEVMTVDGQPVLRFMRPFVTEKSCLKCHADQGYKEGDIRGGISVNVPLDAYNAAASDRTKEELSMYAAIWSVGLVGLYFGFRQLNRRRNAHQQVMEALIASEVKLATIFHQAPVLITIISMEDNTYCDVNDYAVQVSGFSREEIIGRTSDQIGWSSPQAMEKLRAVLKVRGRLENTEAIFQSKSGRDIQMLLNSEVIRINQREFLLSVAVDITEHRQMAAALAKNEAELFAIYEHAPAMMLLVDQEGCIRRRNRAAANLESRLSIAPADPQHSLLRCIRTANTQTPCCLGQSRENCALRNAVLKTFADGSTSQNIEIHVTSSDALPTWLLASTALVQIGSERLVLVCIEDVSKQRSAEQRIREQAALLDVTHDAIVVIDKDTQVTFWNKGAEKLYGHPAADATGKPFAELFPSDKHRLVSETLRNIRTNGSWQGNWVLQARDGRPLIVLCNGVGMNNATSSAGSILLSAIDITEAKQIETQLLRTQRLESIGSLAAGVAHDLNNVFGPIMLSISTLRSITRGTDASEIVELIDRSVHRGSDIVRKLLLFGRGSEGAASRENVLLATTIFELHHILTETFPKNISFGVNVPAELWRVHGDKTQLYQVLLNLCVNARDAMPGGGRLEIAAENLEADSEYAETRPGVTSGRYVRIRVSDTGSGISPAIIDKIFDPFFTTKPVGRGSGLGLSTSLGIVRSHGGVITVESKPEQGSTFTVILPACTGNQTAASTGVQSDVNSGHGERILIVDDEASITRTMKMLLTATGYQVTCADSGREALSLINNPGERFDLMITDIMMPGMDGFSLSVAVRQNHPELPIIVASGLRDNRAQFEKLKPPSVVHLYKPFEADDLLAAIQVALQAVRGPAA
ncbi:MAG: PAS domain S-box protein [Nibricoccus sp.]